MPDVVPKHKVCDLSGQWEYRCRPGRRVMIHEGGTVIIVQEDNMYGVELRLSGTRDWKASYEADGKLTTNSSHSEQIWQSVEGAFVSPSAIHYRYSVQDGNTSDECQTSARITIVDSKAIQIVGTCSYGGQTLFVGNIEFRRMKDSTDRIWVPAMSE